LIEYFQGHLKNLHVRILSASAWTGWETIPSTQLKVRWLAWKAKLIGFPSVAGCFCSYVFKTINFL